jgi:hypothetical protein
MTIWEERIMTIARTVIVVALLGMAGCARNDQLACGPALPPITTTTQAAPASVIAPVAVAVAPSAVPVAAAPLTAEQRRSLAMQNRAAVAGR